MKNKDNFGMSFEELRKVKSGTILHDNFDGGLRFIVMRGHRALCAYVGVPLSHPLAGHSYDDLPVEAHGGLTFSREGKDDDGKWPTGFWWYGWDYAHSGDADMFDSEPSSDETKWTVEMVVKDSWSALYDFKKLLRLSERIAEK